MLVSLPTYSLSFYSNGQYAQNLHKQNISSLSLLFPYLFLSFFFMSPTVSTSFLLFFPLLFSFLLLFYTCHLLFFFLILLPFHFSFFILFLSTFPHFLSSTIFFSAASSFSNSLLHIIPIFVFVNSIETCYYLSLALTTLLLSLLLHISDQSIHIYLTNINNILIKTTHCHDI